MIIDSAMSAGYVYVLVNEEMPNLVKVGRTSGTPEIRARQLSSATGVPKNFVVYKAYAVKDSVEAEKIAHSCLAKIFDRPNSGREFFSGSPHEISLILNDLLTEFLVKPDAFSVEHFLSGLDRLKNKEFSFAGLEFEDAFSRLKVTMGDALNSETLITVLGAYVAACAAVNRRPIYSWIFAAPIRERVVGKAIKFAGDFEDDPATLVIGYARGLT